MKQYSKSFILFGLEKSDLRFSNWAKSLAYLSTAYFLVLYFTLDGWMTLPNILLFSGINVLASIFLWPLGAYFTFLFLIRLEKFARSSMSRSDIFLSQKPWVFFASLAAFFYFNNGTNQNFLAMSVNNMPQVAFSLATLTAALAMFIVAKVAWIRKTKTRYRHQNLDNLV